MSLGIGQRFGFGGASNFGGINGDGGARAATLRNLGQGASSLEEVAQNVQNSSLSDTQKQEILGQMRQAGAILQQAQASGLSQDEASDQLSQAGISPAVQKLMFNFAPKCDAAGAAALSAWNGSDSYA